jgi:hypothetical protein
MYILHHKLRRADVAVQNLEALRNALKREEEEE